MNPIVAGALAGVIVGIPSFVIAVVTLRQTRASHKDTMVLEERRVGREEFDSVTRELRESLDDEKTARIAAEQRAQSAETRSVEAERRAVEAEQRAVRTERRVTQLEGALRAAEIPVPPCETQEPSDDLAPR